MLCNNNFNNVIFCNSCTADLYIGIFRIQLAQYHLVLLKVPFPFMSKYVGIKISCIGQNVI